MKSIRHSFSCAVVFLILILTAPLSRAASTTRLISNGLSTVAVPCIIGSNTLAVLLPAVPEGTQFYKILNTTNGTTNNARWTINQFQSGAWLYPSDTLRPGEGAFIRNPGSSFSVTFTGPLPAPSFRPALNDTGYYLLGLPFAPQFDFTVNDGDEVLVWLGNQWSDSYEYLDGFGWFPSDPFLTATDAVLFHRYSPGGLGTRPLPNAAIYFNNYIPATGVNSPLGTTYGCIGTNFVAQLWCSTSSASDPFSTSYLPVGSAVPVMGENNAAFLDPHSDLLVTRSPELSANDHLFARVFVWDQRDGALEAARSKGGTIGQSSMFTVDFGDQSMPPNNLPSFPMSVFGPLTPFPLGNQPSTVSVFVGASTQLALPLGFPYTFQWQKEHASNTWANIPSATSNVLNFASTTAGDSGNYRALVTLDCTNRVSATITLTVGPILSAAMIRASDGALVYTATARAGFHYQLESSQNLTNWMGEKVFSNAPAQWSVEVTNRTAPRSFYRLRVIP